MAKVNLLTTIIEERGVLKLNEPIPHKNRTGDLIGLVQPGATATGWVPIKERKAFTLGIPETISGVGLYEIVDLISGSICKPPLGVGCMVGARPYVHNA